MDDEKRIHAFFILRQGKSAVSPWLTKQSVEYSILIRSIVSLTIGGFAVQSGYPAGLWQAIHGLRCYKITNFCVVVIRGGNTIVRSRLAKQLMSCSHVERPRH